MYAPAIAAADPTRTAILMAGSGERISYAEFEQRANRLAHWLRAAGLARLDHYAVFMENNAHYFEACGAGERAGLYYTCVNSYLTPNELAYILDNSESQVLITSAAKLETARAALDSAPSVRTCLVVGGGAAVAELGDPRFLDFDSAVADCPSDPIPDEYLGAAMLYSSGTTGRPKGVLRPLPENSPAEPLPIFTFIAENMWRARDGMRCLIPAPLFHVVPLVNANLALRYGGTAVLMEKFDAETCLALVEEHAITHTQLVPTMFNRMLKLPEETRRKFDLGSLEFVAHGAAPCPQPVKRQILEWFGPVVHEYYGATEGMGLIACDTAEWLAHPGTVGRVLLGELHVLDEGGNELPTGEIGELWFTTASPFEYFKDPEKTAATRSADGTGSTVGDVGYVDADGYVYLTDRSTFMIISGGVNVYPQECENLLVTHPLVADAAVFGVPNDDLGEEVKAVVELVPGAAADEHTARVLVEFCRANLASIKCPRSIDFIDAIPRLPTGKLYKTPLREKYWVARGTSRLV
ncbi:MAG: AMP-binding protein [Sporichthyaceae bacterium]